MRHVAVDPALELFQTRHKTRPFDPAPVNDLPPGRVLRFIDNNGGPAYLLHEANGDFRAFSAVCTHAGCTVGLSGGEFVCPCHGGVYDFQGLVVGGPPVRPLDRFVTRLQNGQVQLGPRYSVNSRLERFAPRDPGEHLDGLWKYLYPKRFTVPSPQ